MTRSQNVDSRIATGSIGYTQSYHRVFPYGIAGAYEDYMTNTILPQINTPPQYLKSLIEDVFWPDIMAAYYLPDVYDPQDPDNQGQYYDQWEMFYKFFSDMYTKYYVGDVWTWDYQFTFSWGCPVTGLKRSTNSTCDRMTLPIISRPTAT